MDGTLYKWYGPFQRWQKRYCTINNGQLDIYASKESSLKNCNLLESHHIASANVNPTKDSDLEWTMQSPGKSVLHFKVDRVDERKSWLKLIGSAKACIANTSVLMKGNNSVSPATPTKHLIQTGSYAKMNDSDTGKTKVKYDNQKEIDAPVNGGRELESVEKTMQEWESIKAPSVETLASVCQDLQIELSKIQERCNSENEDDMKRFLHFGKDRVLELFSNFKIILHSISARSSTEVLYSGYTVERGANCIESGMSEASDSGCNSSQGTSPSDVSEERSFFVQTFFNTVKVSFADVMVEATANPDSDMLCSVKSETYIAACIQYTRFFDLFAGTLLAPLKSDMLSNAEKVKKAFSKNPLKYTFLQTIFEEEIWEKSHLHPDSATQAVLWMMRGLRTISTFIMSAASQDNPFYKDSSGALEAAYREHLRRYHNFVVQKMFTMGIKLVPNIDHFKKQVVMDSGYDLNSTEVENEIMKQAIDYCQAMKEVVISIEKIYIHHKIDL